MGYNTTYYGDIYYGEEKGSSPSPVFEYKEFMFKENPEQFGYKRMERAMKYKLGEKKIASISIFEKTNKHFKIDKADYNLYRQDGSLEDSGIAGIRGSIIWQMIMPQTVGEYDLEFTYHIEGQILKAHVDLVVT